MRAIRLSIMSTMAAAALVGCATAPAANGPVRLFDAHTHMMTENITPDEEVALLKKVGIDRVLFMHNEPEVIAAVAKKYPGFVVPSAGLGGRNATKGLKLDENSGAALLKAKTDGLVCSFGEVNGQSFATGGENLKSVYAAAASTGAPINMHIDLANPQIVAMVEAALSANPKMNMVLAHLGWTAGPDLIGRLLDAHPNLYTDVSIRFDAPGSLPWRNNGLDLSILNAEETIQPAWRALMERHPNRFLFAMDINSFGPRYTITNDLVVTARKALAPLPRPLQEAIGHGNLERLLKGCGDV